MNAHSPIDTAVTLETGVVRDIPMNKLKASPKNARRTPHTEAAIEALAASIAAKGVLQAPVVEPEYGEDGEATGFFLVTIGEGRRLALRLLAKRKQIKKTEPVSCRLDLTNDPHEISLDENVTRSAMHPADEFEAFRRLAEERGLGAEEIGARFGVSAQVVRQRLRLGAVSPKLMAVYREGELTLDQLMAFAVTEDHDRQEQVYDQLSWNRSPALIRQAMTETKVPANDRRARFVGVEAYAEAGGSILRDLFTEDGGGWLEDVGLLDRLVLEKLDALAEAVRQREGWKWAQAHLDYPHSHGLRRVYPHPVERTPEEAAKIAALADEYDALVSEWDAVEDLPAEVEARFKEIDAALEAYGEDHAYAPEDIARGGVFVILGQDGQVRIERGLIRPKDEPPAPEVESAEGWTTAADLSEPREVQDDDESDGLAPLSEKLVLDLTAHRTQGLRDALAADPTLALMALTHALAVRTFYPPYEQASCVDVKVVSAYLDGHAPGVTDSPAGRRIAERHEAWAKRLPREADEAWAFVMGLDSSALLDLLAYCVSLGVSALRNPLDRRPAAWAHADLLAQAAGLDMTTTWTATAASYFGRVAKARILEAVTEAKGAEVAAQISGLRKGDMAEAAGSLTAGTGWLPQLLRSPGSTEGSEPQAICTVSAG